MVVRINRAALSEFMEREGMRPTDLAHASGVSKSYLSELLSGTKTEASPAVVKRLSDALNLRSPVALRELATDAEAVA